jgi:ribose 5-phosphate isomerase B
MRIAVGSDHAGFSLKESLKEALAQAGHDVVDAGVYSEERADYPVFAELVARAVDAGEAERGVLVCGSGIGMCIAANRFPGVRASVLGDSYDAEMSRRHNDANVACFGARKLEAQDAAHLLRIFLSTPFEGGRHEGRVKKLSNIRTT